tara:strand:- start:701 stop:934 length:234 start_codon:yes stop_codon:yes gene_type:complete
MSIQAQTVLNSLKVCSDVKIVFKSLTSDKTHIGHYTLKGRNVGQASDTETIVAWDIENEKWQDIRVSTITMFIGIPD